MTLEIYTAIGTPIVIFGFATYFWYKDRKEKLTKKALS